MTRPLIALLTDFGHTDPYVGVMKAVMKSITPEAEFIDLTHEIRPQAVSEAAFLLSTCTPFLPVGTIVLSVVDPGVGSDRAALAVRSGRHLFVAPDNGLLTFVWRQTPEPEAHSIVNTAYRLPAVSSTFHGRDIFAPAAAHLAAGVPLDALGPCVPDIELLSVARPVQEKPGVLRAEVLHVDHFGNLVTSVRAHDLPRDVDAVNLRVQVGATVIEGLHATYSAAVEGQALVHWGSSGHLEVAVRGGNASSALRADIGTLVHIQW